ncbi:MAG: cyclic nucleotide-binding domain-containing protein [Pseudomonadota bacterium]
MGQLSQYREHLRALVPINRLPKDRQDTVLAVCEVRNYVADTYVYRKGDDDDNLYYLLDGAVTLYWQHKPIKQISADSVAAKRAFDRPGAKRHSIKSVTDAAIAIVPSDSLAHEMREAKLVSPQASLEVSDIAQEKSSNWMIRLLQSPLFSDLPATNIQGVFEKMARFEVRADQVVIEQGQPGDYYFVIEQGFCEVTRQISGARRAIHLADLKPGDAFGEEALVADRERGATVTMLTDGVLMRLAKTDFKDLIQTPLLKPVAGDGLDNALAEEARCIDIRYPEMAAANPIIGALNIPFNVIRLQAARLDKEYQYIVCGESASQNAVGAFLLLERGVSVRYLDGTVEELRDVLENRQHFVPEDDNNMTTSDERWQNIATALRANRQSANWSDGNQKRGNNVSSDEAINRLENTIDRIDRVYLEKEQELEARQTVPENDYAQTATGKRLADLIDEMERSQHVLNNGVVGTEDERTGVESNSTPPLDMDVTGGADRVQHLSETANPNILLVDTNIPLPAEIDLADNKIDDLNLNDDPIAAMMREFENRMRDQLNQQVKQQVSKIEEGYGRKLKRLQQVAAQEVKKRQAAYKRKVDVHYKQKELQLRKHYHKLMALANKVTAQKAQLQDARRQFEDKLHAANALYKEVEDMRATLKQHLGGDIEIQALTSRQTKDDAVS